MNKLLLTVNEAGELTGVCRATAYKLANDGTWPMVRIGSSIRIPLDGLKSWVEEQTGESGDNR